MVEPIDGVFLAQDEDGRSALCEAIEQADQIAVDTEFHAERRFIPELMLMQIATGPESIWLLDPRAIDPAPVAKLLGEKELIVHGGQQDLRILTALGARPTRLLDTQQAAGLLGVRYPERLSVLCEHFLDIPVDKSATLTDWSTRPLTSRQLRYAAEDARLLLPLSARLRSLLDEQERTEWAFELGAEQCTKASRGAQPEDLLQTWEICSRLEDDARKVIAALQVWRFQQAQHRDQPMYYILPDSMLLDIARRRPTSIRSLAENRRLHHGLIKRHGRTILGCIQDAISGPVPRPVPTLQQHRQARLLAVWAELIGEEMHIAPRLLLPDPMKVVRTGTAGLTGWRKVCKTRLENFLTGKEVITIDGSLKKSCLRATN